MNEETNVAELANQWEQVIYAHQDDAGDGEWLEDLICELGQYIPEWDVAKIIKWEDWEDRLDHFQESTSEDVGIDNVGITRNGALIAIQCKARSGDATLSYEELAKFGFSAGHKVWSERWVVSNAKFSKGVLEANARNESHPLKLVDFIDPIHKLASESNKNDPNLTEMQDAAVAKVLKRLPEHAAKGRSTWNVGEARGHIVLPCGTGKTRIAYRVMKGLCRQGDIAVVLVPSIALVRQIKREFQKLARIDNIDLRTLAVCSDSTAGRTTNGRRKSEDSVSLKNDLTVDISHVHSYEVVGDTATDEEAVIDWLKENSKSKTAFLALFSTYQSSHNTAAGLRKLDLKARLMVADEAHRTAGIKKIPPNGERIRNFTLCHQKDEFPATYRLYQTATPRIYTQSNRLSDLLGEDDSAWDIRSMHDEDTFGPELFRITYVEAVERDLLSDYRIIAWGISETEATEAERIVDRLNELEESDTRWTSTTAIRALTLAAFCAGCVPDANVRSVIAFCNRIKISDELSRAVNSEPIQDWLRDYFTRQGLERKPAAFGIQHVDASFNSSKRDRALHELTNASMDRPYCISNVGIFGEGTDSPSLSAVAFLNPRKSPVDVIQAVGRAMRKSPEKDFGFILVPVVIPKGRDPEHFLLNADPKHGWEELGQILQALRAHDGRIEDHLEDLMTFYCAPEPIVESEHLVITKDPYQPLKKFILKTKTPTIEQVVAPQTDDDTSDLSSRLENNSGTLTEIENSDELDPTNPPKTVTLAYVSKDGTTRIKDFTYQTKILEKNGERQWTPAETIENGCDFIKRDISRRNRQMHTVQPRKKREIDRQRELGLKLIKLEGDAVKEAGIHLNLLSKSGIQSGSKRDSNLLRGTVNAVARLLRQEELEDILAARLGMENVDRKSDDTADACAVTAVIWVNAAIMHARLEKAGIRQLRRVPAISDMISHPQPAKGLIEAWREVLIKDYVPIFKIAQDLLTDVAFKDVECVTTALRRVAKDAVDIAEHYVNLGMDHAGELFNAVMGNQRSDGAYFTRPIAAAMLVELALSAYGRVDWLNESNWEKLRSFDPACGSGTILVAMLTAMKRRIRQAGGDEKTIKRFHRFAVENLIYGADINPVSIQLAACQLTLGDMSVSYDRINLFRMPYGADPDNIRDTTSTGTIELLLDSRISPESGIEHATSTESSRLNMEQEWETSLLSDELNENKPTFVLMNPPYTAWNHVGEKFDIDVQQATRERLSALWEHKAKSQPLLEGKKSSIALLFEALALNLSELSQGIMGFVCAHTITTAEDNRKIRRHLASGAHIDYVVSSHDPTNFNLSWNTEIHECLIVMSHMPENRGMPTLFVNLHRFPESVDEALEVIDKAINREQFNGSAIAWDYEKVLEGDWTPAVYADCTAASLANAALHSSPNLRTDLVGLTGKRTPPPRETMARWQIRYLEVMLNSRLTQQEVTGE